MASVIFLAQKGLFCSQSGSPDVKVICSCVKILLQCVCMLTFTVSLFQQKDWVASFEKQATQYLQQLSNTKV